VERSEVKELCLQQHGFTKTMTKPLGKGAWDKKITKYIIGAMAEN